MFRAGRIASLALIVALAWLAAGCGDDSTGPDNDSHGPEHLWSARYGDASDQQALAVCFDDWAGAIVAGIFAGTVDFGGGALTSAGGRDFFLARFGTDHQLLWSRRLGDSADQTFVTVGISQGNNFVLAGELDGTIDFGGGPLTSAGNGDVFVAKYVSNGTHLWSKRFGDADVQTVRGVAADASGNVIITGILRGSTNFGGGTLTSAGSNDIFLAKFSTTGAHVWSKRFGDAGLQTPLAVAVDTTGNVVVAGFMAGTVNFGGGALTSGGDVDVFVAKFAPDGTHLWSRRFGDASSQEGNAVACDEAGDVFVTGRFGGTVNFGGEALTSAGSLDVYVVKFDPDGTHLWSRRFGDTAAQFPTAIAVDPSGDAVVAGAFLGTVDFGGGALTCAGQDDLFLAGFDAAGSHLWSRQFGDADLQRAGGLAIDRSGQLVLVGAFYGSVDFGGGELTSAGFMDIFCAGFLP